MIRLALISDTHGMLPDPKLLDGADYVLHAGDIGPDRGVGQWIPFAWQHWCDVIADEHDAEVLATLGNHDFPDKWGGANNIFVNQQLVLHDEDTDESVNLWFSPWSPRFFDWAWMKTEEDLAVEYAKIPTDTDILISHTPPFGLCDNTLRGERVGSRALRQRLEELPNLKHVVCGHIHEGRGKATLDNIIIHNVACVDEYYKPRTPLVTWLEVNDVEGSRSRNVN